MNPEPDPEAPRPWPPKPYETDVALGTPYPLLGAEAGAVAALASAGYVVRRIAALSGGVVVGALLAAGLLPTRVPELLSQLTDRSFRDGSPLGRIPLVGPGLSLLNSGGVYKGAFLRDWLAHELLVLGVRTFGDLKLSSERTGLDPDCSYKLVVIATDVTLGTIVRLPWDYRDLYGLDPDDQLVADAVRAAVAIPFFNEPVRLQHYDGQESLLFDGSVRSALPVGIFDPTDDQPPRCPTLGIAPVSSFRSADARLLAPKLPGVAAGQLLDSFVTTIIAGDDPTHLRSPWVAPRTIRVDMGRVNPVDFDLAEERQELFFKTGFAAANRFLETFEWTSYRERYGSVRQQKARSSGPERV